MKERPILFSGEMVRAILKGRKTQTRRVAKFPKPIKPMKVISDFFKGRLCLSAWYGGRDDSSVITRFCPYGVPGDRLWVREAFWNSRGDDSMPTYYKADQHDLLPGIRGYHDGPWKPSIHMPRWASRITLEITEIRAERIQEISPADCIAEGIGMFEDFKSRPALSGDEKIKNTFRGLWDSINKKRGYRWGTNPWVWALTFKRINP
jgi:hypothetical protein